MKIFDDLSVIEGDVEETYFGYFPYMLVMQVCFS